MKLLVRIPRQKFGFVEVEFENADKIELEKIEASINNVISILDKYSSTDLEVVLVKKTCPECDGRVLEMIGFSEKTNKPYHRLKCENSKCNYVEWVEVAAKNG